MWFLMLIGVGCSPPELEAVSPVAVPAGDAIEITGDHLSSRVRVTLARRGGSTASMQPDTARRHSLAVQVPEGLEPGLYDVVVARRGKSSSLPNALEVVPPVDETPCSDKFTANTELSFARSEVVVDRFYESGSRETVRLPLESVDRLEYEMLEQGNQLCSVIYLRTIEGKRVVFHDDPDVDLRPRAEKIAADMGLALDVAVRDAAAMGEE